MNKQIDIFQVDSKDIEQEWLNIIRETIYGCGKPVKIIAADLDYSPQELTRRLSNNPNDHIELPLRVLPNLIAATGSQLPIKWLKENFLLKTDEQIEILLGKAS